VSFDDYRPPSLMQAPEARQVAVELNSLSKSYNMAGWRLGMAVGNPEVLSHLYALKVKVDSSHYGPIQQAGAAALTGHQSWLAERNARYQERRNIVVAALREAGLDLEVPQAALYVWAALQPGEDEVAYCHQLASETGVSVTPGTVFGSRGAGYIRISLCTPTDRLLEAMDRLRSWVRLRGQAA
jgi:LL-diaminopimelate aminotransferase